MLKIRPAQIKAFTPAAEAAFERRVADYLREEHAGEVVTLPAGEGEVAELEVKDLDDETLLKMVRGGIARARAYGMTWEATLATFVVTMFIAAPNFDGHPLIRRVLSGAEAEPDLRLDLLWEQTTEENWQAVREQYDSSAWNLGE
ncbi:MAG TPA: hypothetical protein VF621_04800 [Pyrinomonadaceae bacterium]|jgi:hypothetical protein